MPLSTKVYKWVLANLMLGVTLRYILLVASSYRNQGKLWPDWPCTWLVYRLIDFHLHSLLLCAASPDCDFDEGMCDWDAQEGWSLDKRLVNRFDKRGKMLILPCGVFHTLWHNFICFSILNWTTILVQQGFYVERACKVKSRFLKSQRETKIGLKNQIVRVMRVKITSFHWG